MKHRLMLVAVCITALSCSDLGIAPEERDLNIHMQYGITAKNEINTFRNTCTKDLILDGTVTIPFVLTENELNRIREKALQIGFFDYPDSFFVQSSDSIRMSISPFSTYRIRIKLHSTTKTLYWEDRFIAVDPRAERLKELISLVRAMIESKPVYQQLPSPRGGYV